MSRGDYINWLAAFFKEKEGFTVHHDKDSYVCVDSDDLYIDLAEAQPYVSASASIVTILLLEAVFDMWKKVRD